MQNKFCDASNFALGRTLYTLHVHCMSSTRVSKAKETVATVVAVALGASLWQKKNPKERRQSEGRQAGKK